MYSFKTRSLKVHRQLKTIFSFINYFYIKTSDFNYLKVNSKSSIKRANGTIYDPPESLLIKKKQKKNTQKNTDFIERPLQRPMPEVKSVDTVAWPYEPATLLVGRGGDTAGSQQHDPSERAVRPQEHANPVSTIPSGTLPSPHTPVVPCQDGTRRQEPGTAGGTSARGQWTPRVCTRATRVCTQLGQDFFVLLLAQDF